MKPSFLQDQIIRGLLMSSCITFDRDETFVCSNPLVHNIRDFLEFRTTGSFSFKKETKEFMLEYKKDFTKQSGNELCSFPTKDFLNKIDLFGLYAWFSGSHTYQLSSGLFTDFNLAKTKEVCDMLSSKFFLKVKPLRTGYRYCLCFEDLTAVYFLVNKFVEKSNRKRIDCGDKLAYLAGPMEYSDGEGLEWRREFSHKLSKVGYKSIIPNDEEKSIKEKYDVSMEAKINNIEEYIEGVREFMLLDLTFVEAADCIVCKWEGERCSGTVHEVGYSRQIGTPSYLVTSQPLHTVPGWFLSSFTKCFINIDELISFLEAE
jgi:nucleoside 2-deoxyribosyltransferase